MGRCSRAFPPIDIVKGIVVTLVCIALSAFHLSAQFDTSIEATLMGLMIFGVPAGVGLGALAGELKSDRTIILFGTALAFGSCMVMMFALGGRIDADSCVFEIYPWLMLWAVAVAWWTRRVSWFPEARTQRRGLLSRVRWRRLSPMEIAVVTWIVIAAVIALVTAEGIDDPDLLFVFTTMSAFTIPVGVGVGAVATAATSARIPLLLLVSTVGGGFAMIYEGIVFDSGDFWVIGLAAVAAFVLERLTRPRAIDQGGNATSREAGSTSTTP